MTPKVKITTQVLIMSVQPQRTRYKALQGGRTCEEWNCGKESDKEGKKEFLKERKKKVNHGK